MDYSSMSLRQLALEVNYDPAWSKKPPYGAVPYLEAMCQLDSVNDYYYADDGRSIVLYFLANAQSWRGEVARAVKAELKSRVK
jgi:hypothetical protein